MFLERILQNGRNRRIETTFLQKRGRKKKRSFFSFKWGTIDWRAHDSRGSFFPQIFAWMRFAWKRSTTRTLIIASRMSVDEIFISFVANLRVEKFLPSYLFLSSFMIYANVGEVFRFLSRAIFARKLILNYI